MKTTKAERDVLDSQVLGILTGLRAEYLSGKSRHRHIEQGGIAKLRKRSLQYRLFKMKSEPSPAQIQSSINRLLKAELVQNCSRWSSNRSAEYAATEEIEFAEALSRRLENESLLEKWGNTQAMLQHVRETRDRLTSEICRQVKHLIDSNPDAVTIAQTLYQLNAAFKQFPMSEEKS